MSNADILALDQPLETGGIRTVNFFNGRLLASRDLTREQTARREADWRLGLALGDGVASGFDVSRDAVRSRERAPVLHITKGIAVNRKGQVLRLTENISVAVTRRFDAAPTDCIFSACSELPLGTYISGAGVYVLTVAPAELSVGTAPNNGLDPLSVRCNTDATVEALRFRLHAVREQEYSGLGLGQPWFRNALAYRCFGSDIQPRWFEALLTAAPRQEALIDELRATTLTDADVPIALLFITGQATIEFIDLWAVRRPLSRASESNWESLIDDRRQAVGHAMFMQFQRQILDAAPPSGDLSPVAARTHFKFLPAAGVIPVPEETSAGDVQALRFFDDMTCRGPVLINAAQVEGLLRESLSYPPIDTASDEVIWLYRVRENRMAIELGTSTPRPRSYLVFASGHLRYRADARFDLAYWKFNNYAL